MEVIFVWYSQTNETKGMRKIQINLIFDWTELLLHALAQLKLTYSMLQELQSSTHWNQLTGTWQVVQPIAIILGNRPYTWFYLTLYC